MTREEFQSFWTTLELDPACEPHASMRTATGPTVVFGGLPSVQLGDATNPEFELGATIGEGGMGVVRLARQMALHREVAVKTLRDDRHTESARDGLLHEALVTGGLEHPSVVPVYTLGQTQDGLPVIVMKRIEGVPWSVCIADPSRSPNDLAEDPLGWNLEVFGQLCQAVHFAHSRGIIHRDIKPENVMIGAFGEVYLVDWGVAVTIDDAKSEFLVHARDTHGICGTPCYMAPEQTTGRGDETGVRTDVYLLGATLFHAVTGEPPHRGDSLFEVMYRAYESEAVAAIDGVPEGLLDIVRRAMHRDPSRRYQSAEELRRAVLEFERHRSSIALTAEASARLEELRELVARGDLDDDPVVRGLAGECRFGFEQALRVWSDNEEARARRDDALRELARWEIAAENPRAAQTALSLLSAPDAALDAQLAELRDALAARAENVRELQEFQDDLDLGAGAQFRAIAGFVAATFWAVVPLGAGLFVRHGWSEVTLRNFVIHGFVVMVFLVGTIWIMRRQLMQNTANRRIMRVTLVFAFWLPCYRFVMVDVGISVEQALAVELASYGMPMAAVAIMSGQLALFPLVVYLVGGFVALRHPQWIFEAIAACNILAVGWLASKWRQQSDAAALAQER